MSRLFNFHVMNFEISNASPHLSKYVKHYWSIENCMPENSSHTQRIVPSGLYELIFYFENKPVSSNPNNSINENVILSGQQKDFYDLKITGDLSLFAIYFYPHGLSLFLDLPLNELYNHSIPLRLLLKDSVNKLEDELTNVGSFSERISIAEKFLLNQISKTKKKYNFDRIGHSIDLINEKKGVIDIDILASETCISRKQFERIFQETIGASPKQFLKIVRFQNAIYQKSKRPHLSLTEIAHLCGYFDQAHMINDFKSLSGYTPKKFFDSCEPFSDYFE